MEHEAMLQAALAIFRFYQNVAPVLAEAHGIKYQTELERMMLGQSQELGDVSLS